MHQRLPKVHQIVSSPEYQGQDIHLEDENPFDGKYDVHTYEEESRKETSNTEPITVFLGTLTSTKGQRTQKMSLNTGTLDSYPDKIYAKVKINEQHDMNLKVDTGAVACVITTTDLQHFPSLITILPCNNVLRGYGSCDLR